jgi:precorrin-6x reductase
MYDGHKGQNKNIIRRNPNLGYLMRMGKQVVIDRYEGSHMETAHIWIVGGTRCGIELAAQGIASFYAADTLAEKKEVATEGLTVFTGRLSFDEMCSFIDIEGIDCVLDASRVYDDEVSVMVMEAAKAKMVGYLRVCDEPLETLESVKYVQSETEAALWMSPGEGNILVAMETDSLHPYIMHGLEERLHICCKPKPEEISTCIAAGIEETHILAFTPRANKAFYIGCLKQAKAHYLLLKDEEPRENFIAWLKAANRLGCEIIVIARPQSGRGISVKKALKALDEHNVHIPLDGRN